MIIMVKNHHKLKSDLQSYKKDYNLNHINLFLLTLLSLLRRCFGFLSICSLTNNQQLILTGSLLQYFFSF